MNQDRAIILYGEFDDFQMSQNVLLYDLPGTGAGETRFHRKARQNSVQFSQRVRGYDSFYLSSVNAL